MTIAVATRAWELVVEGTTAYLTGALDDAGVRHIVLKGPLLKRRLFGDSDEHVSADIDIFPAPDEWRRAEEVLLELGFEPVLLDVIPGDRPNHARPYTRRAGGPAVDLHRTLLGAEVHASAVWAVLEAETETVDLCDRPVVVLDFTGQLLHVALHAAQNGPANARTIRYLDRCIELAGPTDATDALRLATAIGATEAFALGLSLSPSGRALSERLRLTPSGSVSSALRATSAPNSAHALEWLATRPRARDRAGFVWHKVFPPRAYMRSSDPRAGATLGLVRAYPARWLWLACRLQPSLRAWRHARRLNGSGLPGTNLACRAADESLVLATKRLVYEHGTLRLARRPLRVGHRLTRYCRAFGPRRGARLFCSELSRCKRGLAVSSTIVPGVDVGVRLGTTDISVLAKVFLEREYEIHLNRKPETIIDAGAYTGLSTVFLAQRFPDATIVALEPDAENHRLLRAHVAGLPNVVAIRAALWPSNQCVRLHDPGSGAWGYRVAAGTTAGDEVEGITVDEVMRRFGLRRIGLLKMDVEGTEAEIFRHAEPWLDHVDAIVIELHDEIVPGCTAAVAAATPRFVARRAGPETMLLERPARRA